MAEKKIFWFNTRTRQVEKGLLSSSLYRIGPFATEEEASRAEEILRQRSRSWAEEDEKSDSDTDN